MNNTIKEKILQQILIKQNKKRKQQIKNKIIGYGGFFCFFLLWLFFFKIWYFLLDINFVFPIIFGILGTFLGFISLYYIKNKID